MLLSGTLESYHFEGCKRAYTAPPWKHVDRVLPCYELMLGIQGNFRIQEGQTIFSVGPGDILLLAPGLRHRGLRESSQSVEFFWLCFSFDPTAPKTLEIPQYMPHLTAPYLRSLANSLQQMQDMPCQSEESLRALTYAFLTAISCEARRGDAGADWMAENRNRRFDAVVSWIRANCANPLTLDSVSREFSYAPSYLAKKFRESSYGSFSRCLTTMRIEHAKQLLLDTNMTVQQIAFACSYADDKLFLRHFKQYSASRPTEFRRQAAVQDPFNR